MSVSIAAQCKEAAMLNAAEHELDAAEHELVERE